MKQKGRSFWSTTTGFVTGVAGLLTGVVGIVTAGTQLGWLGSDEQTPTTPTSAPRSGQATVSPTFSVDPPSVTFEALGSRKATVKVVNTGSVAVAIQPPSVEGTNPTAFSASGCSRQLAPGRSCDVEVTFAPPRGGTYTATLVVHASGGPAREVSLTGKHLL
jgi:hypothetical protein